MYKHTQRSFAGGRLDAELMGRQDLAKYFQGASELKNFTVRRQGYISKRRGTDLACDLGNLLGKIAANPRKQHEVGKVRLVPLVHEKDDGYCLALSNRRAFIVGKNGIRLMDGSWSRTIPESFAYIPEGSSLSVLKVYTDEDYNPDKNDEGETEYTGDMPFSVGLDGYPSLTAALNAAMPGQTVKLNGQAARSEVFSDAKPYAIGDFCQYESKYWRFTAAHSAGAWNAAHVAQIAKEEMFLTEATTVTFASNWQVTIDFNGYRLCQPNNVVVLTLAGGDATKLVLANSGAATFTGVDGTLQNCGLRHSTARNSNVVNLANSAGDLEIGNGVEVAELGTSYAILVGTSNTAAANRVTVNGGRVVATTGSAIYLQYGSPTLAVDGGYVGNAATAATYVYQAAIGAAASSSVAISGGKVECSATGVAVRLGAATASLSMSGGHVLNYATASAPVLGAAGATVSISGGQVECAAESAHYNSCVNVGNGAAANPVAISGGTFVNRSTLATVAASGNYPFVFGNNYGSITGARYYLAATASAEPASLSYVFRGANTSISTEEGAIVRLEEPPEYDEGVQQQETPAAEEVAEETEEQIPADQDKRPYYVNVPYGDDDLDALDYTQSGDTLFFAHRSYAPHQIRLESSFTLAKTRIRFSGEKWKRPRILSVTASGTGGTGAAKTVYYKCTYVKDGVESEPSLAFGYSYKLPWPNTFTLTVECDRGANAEEPDYYNIYKLESTEYGLIATTGSASVTIVDAELSAMSAPPELVPFATSTYINDTRIITSIDQVKNARPEWYWQQYGSEQHPTAMYNRVAGGYSFDGGALFAFGPQSGQVFTRADIRPDSLSIVNGSIVYYFAGTHFRAILKTADNSGAVQTFTVEGESAAPAGTTPQPGANSVGSTSTQHGADIAALERTVSFDFKDQLETAYPNAFSSGSQTKDSFQVVSLYIEAFDNATDLNRTTLYLSGSVFRSTLHANKTFEDDYVTPDLSQTPPVRKPHFDAPGDYPGCVGIHQQRLVYASSQNDPFTLWMSAVGDLYDFSPHESIREDDPLQVTTGATEFPKINHLVVNRDLMAFADSGEWRIAPSSGNALTYKTIAANMQSAIGSSTTLKPLAVGDEIVFSDRTGQRLYATRYNWSSDGYESNDLSVLSQWLFKNNPIVAFAYRQNPDSMLECVLADGTMATLVYMKEHEVCAWSRSLLGGGWLARDIACTKAITNGSSEVMLLVERDGAFALWRQRDDIPVRSGVVEAADHLCMDGARELAAGETAALDETVVDCVTKRIAGYAFEATLVTVRPEVQGAAGTIQFELKNAKDAEVRVLDSSDFSCRAVGVPPILASAANTEVEVSPQDGTVELASGDYKLVLAGDSTGDGRVEVKSDTVLPLNILSISVDYEIQPLSESEG